MNTDKIRGLCENLYNELPQSGSLYQAARLFLEGEEAAAERLLLYLYTGNAPQDETDAAGDLLFSLLVADNRYERLAELGFPRNDYEKTILTYYLKDTVFLYGNKAFAQKMPPAAENLPVLSPSFNGREALMLFDTGAMITAITRSLAKSCGATPTGGTIRSGGFTREIFEAESVIIPEISFGEMRITNKRAMVLEDRFFDFGFDESGTPIRFSGFFGWDIIRGFTWTLDMLNRTITAEKPRVRDGERNLRWDMYPIARFEHGGDTLFFCFDTGCTQTCMADVMKKRFQSLSSRFDDISGPGSTVREEVALASEFPVKLGNSRFVLNDVPILNRPNLFSHFFSVPGLFGIDAARGNTLVVDFYNRILEIKSLNGSEL